MGMACRNYTGVDNSSMRINLVTPFAEKDAVKSLGARRDSTRKVWYIQDVADLTPYLRWIPNLEAATEASTGTEAPEIPVNVPLRRSASVVANSAVVLAGKFLLARPGQRRKCDPALFRLCYSSSTS